MELVDMPDLGSGAARRGGSSPFSRTEKMQAENQPDNGSPFYVFFTEHGFPKRAQIEAFWHRFARTQLNPTTPR